MLFRVTLTSATAIAAAAIGLASPVQADETAYLNDMHNAGITSQGGDSDLLSGGWAVCKELAAGSSRQQIAAEMIYASDKYEGSRGIDPKDADQAVVYANDDLCPGA